MEPERPGLPCLAYQPALPLRSDAVKLAAKPRRHRLCVARIRTSRIRYLRWDLRHERSETAADRPPMMHRRSRGSSLFGIFDFRKLIDRQPLINDWKLNHNNEYGCLLSGEKSWIKSMPSGWMRTRLALLLIGFGRMLFWLIGLIVLVRKIRKMMIPDTSLEQIARYHTVLD